MANTGNTVWIIEQEAELGKCYMTTLRLVNNQIDIEWSQSDSDAFRFTCDPDAQKIATFLSDFFGKICNIRPYSLLSAPPLLTDLAKKCREIVERAKQELGVDVFGPGGHSMLDLVADNIESEPLDTLKAALVVAGYAAEVEPKSWKEVEENCIYVRTEDGTEYVYSVDKPNTIDISATHTSEPREAKLYDLETVYTICKRLNDHRPAGEPQYQSGRKRW